MALVGRNLLRGRRDSDISETSASQVYVGRQAILDRQRRVAGYELLYRDGTERPALFNDNDEATATLASNAILEFGLDRLAPGVPAFINVSGDFLISGAYRTLPKERVVLELLEDQRVDDALRLAIKGLRRDGYKLALDDYVENDPREELIAMANMVKVDLPAMSWDAGKELCQELNQRGVIALAEKVELPEDFLLLREAGYSLFQGYFFERPSVVGRRSVRADRLALFQLYSKLQDPEVDVAQAADIARRDIELSYRLLRLVNSAAFGLSRQIEDVRDAVALLGLDTLRNVTALLSLTRIDGKPKELTMIAMVRAKMCEELAGTTRVAVKGTAFTAGLLSVLDGFFDAPVADVLKELPLSPELSAALIEREGPLGLLLDAVIAYEAGDTGGLQACRASAEQAIDAYMSAVDWAEEVRTQLMLGR